MEEAMVHLFISQCILHPHGLSQSQHIPAVTWVVFPVDVCKAPQSTGSLKASRICQCQKRAPHVVPMSDSHHF